MSTPEIGSVFEGKYKLISALGHGGFAGGGQAGEPQHGPAMAVALLTLWQGDGADRGGDVVGFGRSRFFPA